MLYSDKHNMIFVAVPKTATRSIYSVLKTDYKGKLYSEHYRVIPNQFKNYFSFIVVRNPYDRACSAYWHACKREVTITKGTKWYDRQKYLKRFSEKRLPNTLESFLTLTSFHQIAELQYKWHEKNRIDQILRFENLQEDFNTLPFLNESIELPFSNRATKSPWQEMIDSTTGQMINDIYKRDFEMFGYERLDF